MDHNAQLPTESGSATPRRQQRHRKRSTFSQWLHRVRSSKREKRKLIQLIVIVSAVLLAFMIGYFYFGPSFTFSEAS